MNKAESKESKWINVADEMPKNGKHVIATYINNLGNRRRIIGYFVEQYCFPSGDGVDENDEYCEEDDVYYLCAGWYEQQDNWDDYAAIYVNQGEVDYWIEIPFFSKK